MRSSIVKNKIIERYELLRCDVADGIRYGYVDPIEGQNWLDINEARMEGAQ